MRIPRYPVLLPVVLLSVACGGPAFEGDADEFDAPGTFERGLGLDCASALVCSGSTTGANTVHTSLYRVGTTTTSRGDLLQTFTAPLSGTPTVARLVVHALRAFTAPPATMFLHVELHALTPAGEPLVGSPVAQGTWDLAQALPANGLVEVPLEGDPVVGGARYGLFVNADAVPAGGSGTSLFGIGALADQPFAGGDLWRRGVRRLVGGAWGESRLRPAGTADLAFALAVNTTPDVPGGLVVSPTNGAVLVSWTAPAHVGGSAVSSYVVTAQPGGLQQSTANGSTTSLTFTGLTNGTAYTFSVAAVNGQGGGPSSASSASVTPRTVPGAVVGLAVTGTATDLQVSWSAPASDGGAAITGYVVGRSASPTGPFTTVATVTGLSFTDAAVGAGATWYYEITPTNAAGPGAAASAGASTIPTAPSGVTTSAVVTGTVNVSWSAAGGATSYTILRDTSAGGAFTLVVGSTAGTTFADTTVAIETLYYYRVVATNAAGTATSTTVSVTSALGTFPGCSHVDIRVGNIVWAGCNMGAANFGDRGTNYGSSPACPSPYHLATNQEAAASYAALGNQAAFMDTLGFNSARPYGPPRWAYEWAIRTSNCSRDYLFGGGAGNCHVDQFGYAVARCVR